MIEILLVILGLAVTIALSGVVILATVSAAGGVFAGRLLERLGDILIPGRKTGLGASGIVDEIGIVTKDITNTGGLESSGIIQVAGELWKARAIDGQPIAKGRAARVVRVDGMVAIVEIE